MKNLRKWTLSAMLIVFAMCMALSTTAKKERSTQKIIIDESWPAIINESTLGYTPRPGDTIFISSNRTKALAFEKLKGHKKRPIVVVNYGGQVNINDQDSWGALTFQNCSYIKVTGTGAANFKYGFKLAAEQSGLAFTELSTNCEAEFVMIDHDGFFGIYAKKDYQGKPPRPIPVFDNLKIHDCFVQNVTEGMYLGETISPGMKFIGVEVYNNIVLNTGREAIQIANMVEDVEIYNNTFINAGTDNESSQSNVMQIGDNTVSNIYNNIISTSPAFGIISLGMGNNHVENNYIASSRGIFIDNRTVTNLDYTISVVGNYFKNIHGFEVVKNMNELNQITVVDNFWDADLPFFTNASGNENNVVVENNVQMSIAEIEFTDIENLDYSLAANTPEEFQNMGAPGGPIYFETDDPNNPPLPVPEQIVLSSDMLVDEVIGGSLQSPDFLIDEQEVGFDAHPVSTPWKPAYNMNEGPYSFYIDLQAEYHLTQIALHDMNDVRNLEVEIGEPGNWQLLFVEPCDAYNTWKQHFLAIDARYIRFTMSESVNAVINEVVLYGYSLSQDEDAMLKSASIKSAKIEENLMGNFQSDNFMLFPNPVKSELNVSIPDIYRTADFTLSVFDVNGRMYTRKEYTLRSEEVVSLQTSSFGLKSGVYILVFTNENGMTESMRFVKK